MADITVAGPRLRQMNDALEQIARLRLTDADGRLSGSGQCGGSGQRHYRQRVGKFAVCESRK
jgi:hypothetical protein